eukprot:TRINITY_DN12072_c0_g2_i1.p1 TRINITY_DN12072_c0_g2~~TRINITY_DN12072_c0_g2_i1.p1  ORF type:complete len:510 (+),score=105.61 TRINITY_DN12072_c0_g2_i1:61-1590(+)
MNSKDITMIMNGREIKTEVDMKYFKTRAKILQVLTTGDEEKRYVYKISCKGKIYILKGFKIHLEHFNPGDSKSADMFKQSLDEINEIYQEYSFSKMAYMFSPHFAKLLLLDYAIKLASNENDYSYMYLEILFEHGGVCLNDLGNMKVEMAYNLMRQSANALLLLHNIGIAHFDIKPTNMVYDAKEDLLKIIDMGSAFGCAAKKKTMSTTVTLFNKVRSGTLHFAPPEVIRMSKKIQGTDVRGMDAEVTMDGVDVYCWAMSFYSLLLKKSNADLVNDYEKFKAETEEKYKEFLQRVRVGIKTIKTSNSTEIALKKIIEELLVKTLKFKPKERPKMWEIVQRMKNFEKVENINTKYAIAEINNNKNILEQLMITSEQVDLKTTSKANVCASCDKNAEVELQCGHLICKECLVKAALEVFLTKKRYEHRYQCPLCKRDEKLKSLILNCGCSWTDFNEKSKSSEGITKCLKTHSLTSTDFCLVNDYTSFNLSLIHICRCRRYAVCRSRWSPYH